MTVAEMIEALKAMPQDALVVTRGYEGGLTTALPPETIPYRISEYAENRNYYGEFKHGLKGDPVAVFIPGVRHA